MISTWEKEYNLERIELNDCLVSARVSWIGVAVAVPVVRIMTQHIFSQLFPGANPIKLSNTSLQIYKCLTCKLALKA